MLPRSVAVPLHTLSEKLKAFPFMEYALSYALYNWQRRNPRGPIDFDNLQLIRKFEGGPSESGFILVHVSMVAHTGSLVDSTMRTLDGAERRDRRAFEKAMQDHLGVMRRINATMETMWTRSAPEDYIKYRTFIMGIKNQPMFPNGVLYEGVAPEPMFFRGESGANDWCGAHRRRAAPHARPALMHRRRSALCPRATICSSCASARTR